MPGKIEQDGIQDTLVEPSRISKVSQKEKGATTKE
jgi:hypothetical protein